MILLLHQHQACHVLVISIVKSLKLNSNEIDIASSHASKQAEQAIF